MTGNINAMDCNDNGDDAVGTDLDSPAERARRLGQDTKGRKRSHPHCRRCGKQYSLDQWKQFHTQPEPVVDANDVVHRTNSCGMEKGTKYGSIVPFPLLTLSRAFHALIRQWLGQVHGNELLNAMLIDMLRLLLSLNQFSK